MTYFSRRPNPVFSDEYQALVSVLADARRNAGVTQRGLAARLGKAASHIQRIEGGQRRIDLLEFYQIAKLLELEPAQLFGEIAGKLDELAPGFLPREAAGGGRHAERSEERVVEGASGRQDLAASLSPGSEAATPHPAARPLHRPLSGGRSPSPATRGR